MKEKIAVLLSSYNGEKYISDQIESILHQEIDCELSLHIRDDGSKDSTVKIIEEFMFKYDNIFLHKGDNIGYIKSFFFLMREISGYTFYALSDQDDVWKPNKLQIAVDRIKSESYLEVPVLFGSTSQLVYDDLIPFGITQENKRGLTFYNCMIQNILPGHTQVMNQLMVNQLHDEFDASQIYAHDYWITSIASVKGVIVFDNAPYTLYRQHKANTIGYGEGKVGWIKERIKRIKSSDNHQIAMQINYFYNTFCHDLDVNQKKELNSFLTSQRSFFSRLLYIIRCQFYRQKKFESILFKIFYMFAGYNK